MISYRPATMADVDFVVEAIVAAERSGSGHTLYERLFELTPAALETALRAILAEEIGGSELSCENFRLAIDGGAPLGGLAAWVEAEGHPASSFVRAGAWSYALGAERWAAAAARLRLVGAIELAREPGALQLESVYVTAGRRGRQIAAGLIEHAIARIGETHPRVRKAQILSIEENRAGASAFSRAGFAIARTSRSDDPALRALFPGSGRVLWERSW